MGGTGRKYTLMLTRAVSGDRVRLLASFLAFFCSTFSTAARIDFCSCGRGRSGQSQGLAGQEGPPAPAPASAPGVADRRRPEHTQRGPGPHRRLSPAAQTPPTAPALPPPPPPRRWLRPAPRRGRPGLCSGALGGRPRPAPPGLRISPVRRGLREALGHATEECRFRHWGREALLPSPRTRRSLRGSESSAGASPARADCLSRFRSPEVRRAAPAPPAASAGGSALSGRGLSSTPTREAAPRLMQPPCPQCWGEAAGGRRWATTGPCLRRGPRAGQPDDGVRSWKPLDALWRLL